MNNTPVHSASGRAGRMEPGELARLLPLLGPVVALGAGVAAAVLWTLGHSSVTVSTVAAVVVLLAASTLAEAYPVPVESLPAGSISLSAVFVVSAGVMYGWVPAAIVGCLGRVIVEVVQRRPLSRLLYNGSVYGLAGAAAGAAGTLVAYHGSVLYLMADVVLAAAAFWAVNIPLVAAIVARWAREPFVPLLRRWVYWTAVSFMIMASVSLMLEVLWQRSPVLAAALLGPLVAIALYQRSMHRALKAMRLALTDPLTGLGNHRHFQERLQGDLDRAQEESSPLTLCLIDVDDFKRINDRYGHPVGDRVLAEVASCLRQGGEAFRLGGDEFALVLAGRGESEGMQIAATVVHRLAAIECDRGETISVSAGVATHPDHGLDRSDLLRVADEALYGAKRQGKNRVNAYRPELATAAV